MSTRTKAMRLAVAVAILAGLAPVTIAAADGAQASGSPGRGILKQIAALKKTTAGMRAEAAALRAKAAEMEGRGPLVNSLPTGPAGGDLTGTYPNPKIRASAITSATLLNGTLRGEDFGAGSIQPSDIPDQTLGSAQIQNGAIGPLKLAGSSVGAGELTGTHVLVSQGSVVEPGEAVIRRALCPPGELLLDGGAEWRTLLNGGVPARDNVFTTASNPDLGNSSQWDVIGRNGTGEKMMLVAFSLCLNGS